MDVTRVSPIVISPKPTGIFRPWETNCGKLPGDCEPIKHMSPLNSHTTHDSGYESDVSTSSPVKEHKPSRKFLSSKAVQMMEKWYEQNLHHPYPSDELVNYFAENGNISKTQVRKWMANKRVRSNNTLSFNGTIHPKRLQRLKKEHASSGLVRHHPYQRTPTTKPVPHSHWSVASVPLLGSPQKFSPSYFGTYLPLTLQPQLHL